MDTGLYLWPVDNDPGSSPWRWHTACQSQVVYMHNIPKLDQNKRPLMDDPLPTGLLWPHTRLSNRSSIPLSNSHRVDQP